MNIIDFFKSSENSHLIQAVGAIGTLIAALVSLFTLRLIRKQIRNSQRPNVVLGNSIYGECSSINNGEFNIIWIGENDEIDPDQPYSCLAFELLNVGIGFAENVELKEKFNLDKAIEFIKKHDKNNEFDISISDSTLRIKASFDKEWIRIQTSKEVRKLGNFNTSQVNGNKTFPYIFNDEYLAFLSCFSRLRSEYDEFLSLEDFPKLHMTISFYDVDGKKYKNKFDCIPFAINSTSYSFRFIKK